MEPPDKLRGHILSLAARGAKPLKPTAPYNDFQAAPHALLLPCAWRNVQISDTPADIKEYRNKSRYVLIGIRTDVHCVCRANSLLRSYLPPK